MSYMFSGCSSLKYINIFNFNTESVIYMNNMFSECSSLNEINLSNFNTDNVINMNNMFSKCSEQLKNKIKNSYKNIRDEAFN